MKKGEERRERRRGTLTPMAGEERRGEEKGEKRGHSLQWQEMRGEERRREEDEEMRGHSL